MRNLFPSLEAFYSFERFLEPVFQPSKRQRIFQIWQSKVSLDDDSGETFTQHYPLLESSDEPWTLQELGNAIDASGEGNENTYNSNLANVEFASVGIH